MSNTITSYFARITPEQAAEQAARQSKIIQQERRTREAQKVLEESNKAQKRTKDAAQRQQKWRQGLKEKEAKLGLQDPGTLRKIKVMQLRQALPSPRNATSNPTKRHAPRTNPYEPTRWAIIQASRARVGLKSAKGLVWDVQKGPNGTLFQSLDHGTVRKWINKDGTDWTDEVYACVKRAAEIYEAVGKSVRIATEGKKSGPPAQLDKYPGLTDKIIDVLKGIRLTGTVITRALAQSIALAYIQAEAPELFYDITFKCSDSFIRRFLREKLDWKWRKTTQTAQTLPPNWEQLCLDMAFRLVWIILIHNVPPQLVINADQTRILYLGTGQQTWELRGSNQVAAIGNNKKRQFTLMVAVSASGEVLPFQAIYKGLTKASLPSRHARWEGESKKFLFSSGGKKHWSSLATLKEWVGKVVVPHADETRAQLNLPPTQMMVLIIDCWSVHRGEEFLSWMKAEHPTIIILFIPGGCTGVAQPCDMAINRALKHFVKSECVKYLARVTLDQLTRGIVPLQIIVDTTPGTLRDASTAWLTSSWIWLRNQPELVLSAWRQAQFKGWNLSYEWLTRPENRAAVTQQYSMDPAFALSISHAIIPADPAFDEDPEAGDFDDDYAIDPIALMRLRLDAEAPSQVVEADGSVVYVGDEYNSDSESEMDIDFD